MLLKILKDAFISLFFRGRKKSDVKSLLDAAAKLRDAGCMPEAVLQFKQALVVDPYNVIAINDLAALYIRMGMEHEAGALFEQATLLDDTFAPCLVNFSAHLTENYQSSLGEKYLMDARNLMVESPYIDAGLARLKMFRGEADAAVDFALAAWMKGFDITSFGQGYIFNVSYSSRLSELELAAEHRFWAETQVSQLNDYVEPEPAKGRRIRVGYLSPDLRQHSVRYFFRPLLEGHSRDEFEIYIYNDSVLRDVQTEKIRAQSDCYRDVCNLADEDVIGIIRRDELDILVELAGHTSTSRIHLLGRRLARIQMTALGYPPTTGVRSIDYKVLDFHAAPDGAEKFYSERILRLSGSFWCFNPLEETPSPSAPPCVENSYITFGCIGNISKITDSVLLCWARIQGAVPGSRMLIKSLSFQDADVIEAFKLRMQLHGIDTDRVRLARPDTPERLYFAYSEVDIVLDTFPFNGGTTSCFALWMGVPVVTRAGGSLVSRMGASMMMTLGLPECVSSDNEGYIQAAIALAGDSARLVALRKTMREKMESTTLGNGRLYALSFEHACKEALALRGEGGERGLVAEGVLSQQSLLERAERLIRYGQVDGAFAVLDYCDQLYPSSLEGSGILRSSIYELSSDLDSAERELWRVLGTAASGEGEAVRVNLMRLMFSSGRYQELLNEFSVFDVAESYASFLVEVYRRASMVMLAPSSDEFAPRRDEGVSILLCQDELMVEGVGGQACSSVDEIVAFCESAVARKADAIVILALGVFEPLVTNFVSVAVDGLRSCDVLGLAGGRGGRSAYWFDSGNGGEVGALAKPTEAGYSLVVYGDNLAPLVTGARVLAGNVLALKAATLLRLGLDSQLGLGSLQGVDLSIRAAEAGLVLGVAPLLGMAVVEEQQIEKEMVKNFCAKHGFDFWAEPSAPRGVTLPLPSRAHVAGALKALYQEGVA